VSLDSNLGDIPSYPRLAIFTNHSTYSFSCVTFSRSTRTLPKMITCPQMAVARWQEAPLVMAVSRSAVAAASAKGRAVSGKDVLNSFAKSPYHLATTPTFKSGQGGTVMLVGSLNMTSESGTLTEQVRVCVNFPTTEAGIPAQVNC